MAEERTKVTTPKFRLSFPSLFEKSQYGDGKPKYELTMLLYFADFNEKEKKQFAQMKAILDEACRAKFGKPLKEMSKNPNFKRGIRRGEEKEDLDGYGPGMVFAAASTHTRPGVIDRNKQPIEAMGDELYPGCWCRATVTAYAYDNKSKGVAFGLHNVQVLGDAESFETGRTDADEDFDDDADEAWGGDAAPDIDGDDPLG